MEINFYTSVTNFIEMAKIAVLLALGCISFGFLKVVDTVKDEIHMGVKDLASLESLQDSDNADTEMDIKQSSRKPDRFSPMNLGSGLSPIYDQPSPTPPPLDVTECYACTNCPEVTSDTFSKICPYNVDEYKRRRCVVYAEKYKHMKTPWYIRGCASERGSCEDIRQAHRHHEDIVTLLSCYECEGDNCNTNGASSLSDFTMAFLTMVVTPLVAKHTLS